MKRDGISFSDKGRRGYIEEPEKGYVLAPWGGVYEVMEHPGNEDTLAVFPVSQETEEQVLNKRSWDIEAIEYDEYIDRIF